MTGRPGRVKGFVRALCGGAAIRASKSDALRIIVSEIDPAMVFRERDIKMFIDAIDRSLLQVNSIPVQAMP